jgi:carbon storage regulator
VLVLSRKLGERVLVPHCDLSVTIVSIEGNTVRLGITAPTDIGVYREELWRKVCQEGVLPQPLAQTACDAVFSTAESRAPRIVGESLAALAEDSRSR